MRKRVLSALLCPFLISETLITVGFAFVRHDSAIQASLAALAAPSVGKIDDTTIGEAVLL
ncbi:MAG: hypothetical protein IJR07_05925 [Bacteroidaceae bacterium]|nr:hypothetical protein [Bacteroidaceae bacterium]